MTPQKKENLSMLELAIILWFYFSVTYVTFAIFKEETLDTFHIKIESYLWVLDVLFLTPFGPELHPWLRTTQQVSRSSTPFSLSSWVSAVVSLTWDPSH